MCLLFQKPANVTFNDAQLADMWSSNQDGFGIMYAVDGNLHTEKGIGTVAEWITFFRKHESKDGCWHLRFKTHGLIDLTNCHPYDVWGFDDNPDYVNPIAMMHNGILQTGNTRDTSKSDTWHYIRDFIRPLTKNDPDVIFTPAFAEIVGNHIGRSNKFALMDHTGKVQIVNRSSGVEWNGVWFSNTYAWSSRDEALYPGISDIHPKTTVYHGNKWDSASNYKRPSAWENWDDTPAKSIKPKQGVLALPGAKKVSSIHPQLPHKTGPHNAKKLATKVKAKKLTVGEQVKQNAKLDTQAPVTVAETLRVSSDMLKQDVAYIRIILAKDVPLVAPRVTDAKLESAIRAFGADLIEDAIEQAYAGMITENELMDVLNDQYKARLFFNELYEIK